MIAIQDDKNQLAVVTDVSQGGSSLKDGEIEIMETSKNPGGR